MSFLGIDLGTSGLRALLVGDRGEPIGSAQSHYEVSRPHPGWSEQAPQDWIDALEQVVSELRVVHPEFAALRGIGVAGHMHGATLLDEDDDVIRPCILWNDTRCEAEAAELDAKAQARALSGNIVFPGFTAPKLMWTRKHEPDNYARTRKVLLPAAFLNLYLTGDHVADMSDSAGTSWLDVRQRNWSDDLLRMSGMDIHQMPRLVEGSQQAGLVRPELAENWGLQQSVIVAGGAGDNAAAACGIGALTEGQGFVSLGTSGVLLVARDRCAPNPETAVHTFCHAVPERWYQMGVMLSATDCLNWYAGTVGRTPDQLTADLGTDLKSPGSLRFWPYLSGERTPHNDSQIRGAMLGLDVNTTRQDITRAILEGVAYGLRDSFEALRATGAQSESLYAIGGGSASQYWLKLIATVLNTTLLIPDGREFGAALGAARLGLLAATGTPVEDVLTSAKIAKTIDPDPTLVREYQDAYEGYRAAYGDLKQLQSSTRLPATKL